MSSPSSAARRLVALIAAAAVFVSLFAWAPAASANTATPITITGPTGGSVVAAGAVTFTGTASAGQELSVGVTGASPCITTPDGTGAWSCAVPLATTGVVPSPASVFAFYTATGPFGGSVAAANVFVVPSSGFSPVVVTSPVSDASLARTEAAFQFSGTGEPGFTVRIHRPDNPWLAFDSTVVAGDGSWSLSGYDAISHTTPSGPNALTVSYHGGLGAVEVPFTLTDDLGGVAPIAVNSPMAGSSATPDGINFAGTAEPGYEVFVAGTAWTAPQLCDVADGAGAWSCTLVAQPDSPAERGLSFVFTYFGDPGSEVAVPVVVGGRSEYRPITTTYTPTEQIVPPAGGSVAVAGLAEPGFAVFVWEGGELACVASPYDFEDGDEGGWRCDLASGEVTDTQVRDFRVTYDSGIGEVHASVTVTADGGEEPPPAELAPITVTSHVSGDTVTTRSASVFAGTGEPGRTVAASIELPNLWAAGCEAVVTGDGSWSCVAGIWNAPGIDDALPQETALVAGYDVPDAPTVEVPVTVVAGSRTVFVEPSDLVFTPGSATHSISGIGDPGDALAVSLADASYGLNQEPQHVTVGGNGTWEVVFDTSQTQFPQLAAASASALSVGFVVIEVVDGGSGATLGFEYETMTLGAASVAAVTTNQPVFPLHAEPRDAHDRSRPSTSVAWARAGFTSGLSGTGAPGAAIKVGWGSWNVSGGSGLCDLALVFCGPTFSYELVQPPGSICETTVDSSGVWECGPINVPALAHPGTAPLTLVVTQSVVGYADISYPIIGVQSDIAITAPEHNSAAPGVAAVSGTGAPTAEVIVSSSAGDSCTTAVSDAGSWACEVAAPASSTEIVITAEQFVAGALDDSDSVTLVGDGEDFTPPDVCEVNPDSCVPPTWEPPVPPRGSDECQDAELFVSDEWMGRGEVRQDPDGGCTVVFAEVGSCEPMEPVADNGREQAFEVVTEYTPVDCAPPPAPQSPTIPELPHTGPTLPAGLLLSLAGLLILGGLASMGASRGTRRTG